MVTTVGLTHGSTTIQLVQMFNEVQLVYSNSLIVGDRSPSRLDPP
ncbi:MAG: hypothetical protein WBA43_24875 [Elainellaceae cyanobacterium]